MKQQLLSADPQSRRLFLERCAQAAYGLSVLPFLNLTSSRAVAGEAKPAAPVVRGAGFGTAKNIIILNLAGGMSHIDTFDPKTGEAKGPKAAIRTKADFQVTEYLPRIASIADKISVIRSMTAKLGGHELARYFMRTGFEKRGTIKHPWLGAWAQHYLGPSHKTLPSSVCINRNSEHGNGFFPRPLARSRFSIRMKDCRIQGRQSAWRRCKSGSILPTIWINRSARSSTMKM